MSKLPSYRDIPISAAIEIINRLENCNCRSCVKNARERLHSDYSEKLGRRVIKTA